MKKISFLLAVAFSTSGAFSQDLTSKKGEPILPEANDWAIGIEANPFLNYLGNALNSSTSNSAPSWNFLSSDRTIVGKLFKDEKTAYRAILRIGINSVKTVAAINDASNTTGTYPTVIPKKEDSWKHSESRIGLGAGMEMRRGKTRLQGFYGADALLWMSSLKDKLTYGNPITSTSPVDTISNTTSFGGGSNITNDTYGNRARVLTYSGGSTIGVGVRVFIGAEYFILPKISISGDFGWGIGFAVTGKSSETVESTNGSVVATQTVTGGRSSFFSLDVNRDAFGTANGSLRVNLHF